MRTKTLRTIRSAAISVIACLPLSTATPSFADQFETNARSYERGELDKTSEDSFPDSATFDQPVYVGVEDIALMRKLVLAWDGNGIGTPHVSPYTPFGTPDFVGPVVSVIGNKEADDVGRALGDALHVLVVMLRVGELAPGSYMLPWGAASADHIREIGGVPPPSLLADGSFTFTEEHKKLLGHLWFGTPTEEQWNRATMADALLSWNTDGSLPYGDPRAHWAGAATALGWTITTSQDGSVTLSDVDYARFQQLHAEILAAALVMQAHGTLAPGLYIASYNDPWQIPDNKD